MRKEEKKYKKEIRIGEKFNLTTDGIIISNVGAAVRLRRVEGFKVEESCPHVCLIRQRSSEIMEKGLGALGEQRCGNGAI